MRIAIAATPDVAIPTLDYLLSSEHELAFVITRPDKPAGRGKALRDSPVGMWATKRSVPMYKPQNPDELSESLASVDLVITIGYGVILSENLLRQPRFGFVNMHFSLLPAWRGAAPVQRAIENGDEISGVTVFALDKGMDTGPIYLQKEVLIGEEETAGELLIRMAEIGPSLMATTIQLIEKGIQPIAQSSLGISYAPKLTKAEGKISWLENSNLIARKIRAFSPNPGAWTTWRAMTIELFKASPISTEFHLSIGEIRQSGASIFIGCGEGSSLILERVKVAGKREMSAGEWANGARLVNGESFE